MDTWRDRRPSVAANEEIRILAIDRHVSVAEAFGRRLAEEENLRFLGVLADPARTVDAVSRLRPHLCLVDLIFGDGHTGIQALRDIATVDSNIRRLVLADCDTAGSALVAEAMSCRPDGFFSKAASLEELVKAVRVIVEGGEFISGDVDLVAPSAETVRNLFSKGELRVVCALARFGNKREAAAATYYSSETINTYVRRIRKRVAEYEGRDSIRLPDLIAWARHHGFHHVDAP